MLVIDSDLCFVIDYGGNNEGEDSERDGHGRAVAWRGWGGIAEVGG